MVVQVVEMAAVDFCQLQPAILSLAEQLVVAVLDAESAAVDGPCLQTTMTIVRKFSFVWMLGEVQLRCGAVS